MFYTFFNYQVLTEETSIYINELLSDYIIEIC